MVKKFLVILIVLCSAYSLDCLTSSGNIAPWWTIIKLPKSTATSPIPGKSYMYLDDKVTTPTVGALPINDTSALFTTLKQLNADTSISYLLYNDEPPTVAQLRGSTYAHAKGVLAYKGSEGIYIIHSTPKFPVLDSSNNIILDIADTQIIYGQNFMCVKLTSSQVFEIAGLMTLNRPQVYYSRIVTSNANITALASNKASSLTISKGSMKFNSGSFQFTYFAKTAASGLDLWENVLSPYFASGFRAETWGRPYQPSYCTPSYEYDELNILTIAIGKYSWKNTNDHSKWGISLVGTQVCYADINRMDSQKSRGGGAICIDYYPLFSAHLSIIATQDKC
ncbi:DNASE2B_3 [Blepharisma stoltei]|uniref:Uncharacterized protein n=1 Tax=Blepharisma stoltei TaxID=1481888 RepID=A0AAU9JM90_9CILI|nr:unnamed protein product [Blepharisma stoltei]